ncbi:putative leucine-rich repeat receptor-like protein kinase [Capsicum chacoense]
MTNKHLVLVKKHFLPILNTFPFPHTLIILIIFVFPLVSANYYYDTSTAGTSSSSANVVALLIWKASLESKSQLVLSSWKNTSASPCHWDFIHCDSPGRVTEMNMPNNSISGILNLYFSSFSNLRKINLSNKSLYGTLPANIFNLLKLSYLDLGYNDFSGMIPPEIGFLKNLEYLLIDHTRFSGFLPQELGMLESLLMLRVQATNLTGTISASIGPIPWEIWSLTHLMDVDLRINSCWSNTKFYWKFQQVVLFDSFQNSLTGEIPASIGDSGNLLFLSLCGNRLSGSIPSSIEISMQNNRFIGGILRSLKNCTKLSRVRLDNNKLSGKISKAFVK